MCIRDSNNTAGINSGTVSVCKGILKIWHIRISNLAVRVILLAEVKTIGAHFISVLIRFGDLLVKDQFPLLFVSGSPFRCKYLPYH